MAIEFRQAGDRLQELRRGASKEKAGLEVGPFFRPICPKKKGFNVTTLDVFSRDQLIKNYAKDPNVYPHFDDIEEVDIVSSKPLLEAISSSDHFKDNLKNNLKNNVNNNIQNSQTTSTAQPLSPTARFTSVSGVLDYIVTSHHFEHLPNPIQFLQDAEVLLRPGGSLTMAIPIHTRCFDLYKPLSSSGSFIDAYINQQAQPSLGTVFNHICLGAKKKDGSPIASPQLEPNDVTLIWTELEPFQTNPEFNKIAWFEQLQADIKSRYIDAHCHCFNPASFCLIMADLRMLGLVKELQVHDICEHGLEFIVHLQKGAPQQNHPCSGLSRTALVQAASQYSAREALTAAAAGPGSNEPTDNPADQLLRALKNSRSWQLTRPYRAAGSLLRKLRHSLSGAKP